MSEVSSTPVSNRSHPEPWLVTCLPSHRGIIIEHSGEISHPPTNLVSKVVSADLATTSSPTTYGNLFLSILLK